MEEIEYVNGIRLSQHVLPWETPYKNDPLLPSAGSVYNYTLEELLEYEKCMDDPVYFIRTYIKIINIDKGLMPFKMYPYQEEMVRMFHQERWVLGLSSRQSGKTTTAAAFFVWYVIFSKEKTVGVMANKAMMAREILDRIQQMFVNLPRFLKPGVKSWNKGSFQLDNKSRILTSATTASAFRGQSLSILYGDEFAFVPFNIQADFMASVYPTISSGKESKVIFTTTPNGMGGEFYKMWVDAEEGRSKYKTLKFTWRDVPGRDEKWREETIANIGETRFEVEFNSSFLGSSSTLIDADVLRKLRWADPINVDPLMQIFEEPKPNHVYFITVDVAQGAAQDNSTFTVFDITEKGNYRQVCTYANNMIPSLVFPTIIAAAARRYNEAYVLVETNDQGQQVVDILFHDLEYENMLFTKPDKKGTMRLYGAGKLGVKTTKTTKKMGCSNLKSMIETWKLRVVDKRTIEELFVFIDAKQNGTYAADEGSHDDLVMNLVLFAWAASERFFEGLTDANLRLALYEDHLRQLENEVIPAGFVVRGHEDVNNTFVQDGMVWEIVDQ